MKNLYTKAYSQRKRSLNKHTNIVYFSIIYRLYYKTHHEKELKGASTKLFQT